MIGYLLGQGLSLDNLDMAKYFHDILPNGIEVQPRQWQCGLLDGLPSGCKQLGVEDGKLYLILISQRKNHMLSNQSVQQQDVLCVIFLALHLHIKYIKLFHLSSLAQCRYRCRGDHRHNIDAGNIGIEVLTLGGFQVKLSINRLLGQLPFSFCRYGKTVHKLFWCDT